MPKYSKPRAYKNIATSEYQTNNLPRTNSTPFQLFKKPRCYTNCNSSECTSYSLNIKPIVGFDYGKPRHYKNINSSEEINSKF